MAGQPQPARAAQPEKRHGAAARSPAVNASGVPDAEFAGELPMRLRELETPEDLTVTDNIRSMVNTTLEALADGYRTAIMLREVIDRQLRRVFEADLGRGGRHHARPLRTA